jgi:putrescine transport system ATP-binding protein
MTGSSPSASGRGPLLTAGAPRRRAAPARDSSAAPLIQFQGVTRRFGSVVALDRVSLDIHARELFCLLGPSGCGKTTLMRMLAGFEQPDEGRILLDGEDMSAVPPHLRPVNMMFQSYALFPHLTVAENVAFGLRRLKLGRAEIAARVARMIEMVQLQGFEGRKPAELSGGQQQRVALARALARRPRVLLLDEPLGALDRKTRERTQFELLDIQAELGITFMMVTHDQDEAMAMADRIAVMDGGRIVQIGTPRQIYEQPASRSVAAFVGDVNLIEAVVQRVGSSGRLALSTAEGGAALEAEAPEGPVSVGQLVACAVRPEKLTLARRTDAEIASPPVNRLPGRVWDIGYLGDWTVYIVRLENGSFFRATRANAERRTADLIGRDEEVIVSFDPDAALVLTR